MKLRKVLKHINPVATYCYVYEAVYRDNEDYEEVYQGNLSDIPWWLADRYIDTNIDGEGIALVPDIRMNEHGVKMAIVNIYLRGEK